MSPSPETTHTLLPEPQIHPLQLVDDDRSLGSLAEKWMQVDTLSVDTESNSFFAYRERLCLVQIGDGQDVYLVDALAVDLSILRPVFAREDLEIIFHAADNDVRLLKSAAGIEIANLFDTQGATLAAGGEQVGLAGLVKEHYGIELSKKEQRSDWGRRPMTASQLKYAAYDVVYLKGLRDRLHQRLVELDRTSVAEQLFERLRSSEPVRREVDLEGFYRIKGFGALNAKERAVARAIFLARESRAEKIDRPTFMVLGNDTLLRLAKQQPRTQQQLEEVRGLSKNVRQRLAREILRATEEGIKDPSPPPARRPRGPTQEAGRINQELLDALIAWRKVQAKQLGVQSQVVATVRTLEQMARNAPRQLEGLILIIGIGPQWITRWGESVLEVISKALI